MIRDNFTSEWEKQKTDRRDYVRFKQREAWGLREPVKIKPGWLVFCDCGRWNGGHWAEQDEKGRSACLRAKNVKPYAQHWEAEKMAGKADTGSNET